MFESEIQRCEKRLNEAEQQLASAKESLDTARAKKLKELRKFKCPSCGGDIFIGAMPHELNMSVSETRDCERCQRRIALRLTRQAMGEYLDASYNRNASVMGFVFEDLDPHQMTDDQLQTCLDYYLSLPQDGRTHQQRRMVNDWLTEKTRRSGT